jgi:glycosyltransferase involved in cell wall biosynthesis
MSPSVRLLIITTIPESLPFFTDHIAYAKAKGLEVHVLSSPGTFLDKFAEHEGVLAHAVRLHRRITPFQDIIAIFKIWRLLREIRPGIVHAATPKGGLVGTIAAWMSQVPIRIYHLLGLPLMTATGLKGWFLRCSERVSCGLSHQVLCICHSLHEVALSERLCQPEKIKVLANGSVNGIDADHFRPLRPEVGMQIRATLGIPEHAFIVGFVGRIVRDKGLIELSEAWQTLRAHFSSMHLLIVGVFESHDPLPAHIEAFLRSDSSVHLLGEVEDTRSFYAAMDLFVLPTYREGLPNVLLEAAAMELATVATRIPGCIDVVQDGITGTLVPPYDSAALAESISRYMKDPELRKRHGVAGRARVQRDFRPEDVWKALWQEYARLIAKRGAFSSIFPVPIR